METLQVGQLGQHAREASRRDLIALVEYKWREKEEVARDEPHSSWGPCLLAS
jgi:hypothetical protein